MLPAWSIRSTMEVECNFTVGHSRTIVLSLQGPAEAHRSRAEDVDGVHDPSRLLWRQMRDIVSIERGISRFLVGGDQVFDAEGSCR